MEIPVLRLGRILLITIQTELHDQMAEDLQEAVLEHLEDTSAEGVLMDITALEIVDSFISRVISETVKMAGLLGARMVLVGMQPAVTMTRGSGAPSASASGGGRPKPRFSPPPRPLRLKLHSCEPRDPARVPPMEPAANLRALPNPR